MSGFYDLASLAKPLVTAPLALAFLDLDADRRWALGFHDRDTPLTVRQLLSHSSGLPPWRPYTREALAAQLCRPVPDHPLLRPATPGLATYSDLNYRLLAELVEAETRLPFAKLGAASGLSPAPWREAPIELPDAPDAEAWRLATDVPLPARDPRLPQDANARAGMPGHAGFGTTAPQLEAALARWAAAGWPARMAVEAAKGEHGARWGLGLQTLSSGGGRFGQLLSSLPSGLGLHVIEDATTEAPAPAPALDPDPGGASGWWFHLGYTGPALFHRPADGPRTEPASRSCSTGAGRAGPCSTWRRCGPGAGRSSPVSWDNGADEALSRPRPGPAARLRTRSPAPAEDRPRHPGHGMDRLVGRWRPGLRPGREAPHEAGPG